MTRVDNLLARGVGAHLDPRLAVVPTLEVGIAHPRPKRVRHAIDTVLARHAHIRFAARSAIIAHPVVVEVALLRTENKRKMHAWTGAWTGGGAARCTLTGEMENSLMVTSILNINGPPNKRTTGMKMQ